MKRRVYEYVLLAALILIVSLVAVVGVPLRAENDQLEIYQESSYSRSYYDLVYSVDMLRTNMAKLLVSNDSAQQIVLLNKIVRYSTLAQSSTSAFSTENGSMENLNKFFNQLGDYSNTCVTSLANGNSFDGDVYEDFQILYDNSSRVSTALAGLNDSVRAQDFSFVSALGSMDSEFSVSLSTLENTGIEYPSLIYDGPFSDALLTKEAAMLSGREFSEEECKMVAMSVFDNVSQEDIKKTAESGGKIPSYYFSVSDYATIQVSKTAGQVLQFDSPREVTEPTLTEEECATKGAEYLTNKGFEKMTAVWVNNYNSVMYINYAYTSNEVIFYPDMIKLKVASDNGEIIGMECLNYMYNHTSTRTADTGNVTEEEAVEAVSDLLTVENTRYAVIPLDSKELTTVEVQCRLNDDIYFVYVDVTTGKEVNILKVIDSESGKLLE